MIIIAGISTDVGKTVTATIAALKLKGTYWKPIESGTCESSDSARVAKIIGKGRVHKSIYALKAPLSPHHAAKLEGITIDPAKIIPPQSDGLPLIIEMAGGILVPISETLLTIDLFTKWKGAKWILVSRHALGSINQTLLTIEALASRGIYPDLIFNGPESPESKSPILARSGLKVAGYLYPEKDLSIDKMLEYAKKWTI